MVWVSVIRAHEQENGQEDTIPQNETCSSASSGQGALQSGVRPPCIQEGHPGTPMHRRKRAQLPVHVLVARQAHSPRACVDRVSKGQLPSSLNKQEKKTGGRRARAEEQGRGMKRAGVRFLQSFGTCHLKAVEHSEGWTLEGSKEEVYKRSWEGNVWNSRRSEQHQTNATHSSWSFQLSSTISFITADNTTLVPRR